MLGVISAAAMQFVIARAAVQGVITTSAVDVVITAQRIDIVIIVRRENHIAVVGGDVDHWLVGGDDIGVWLRAIGCINCGVTNKCGTGKGNSKESKEGKHCVLDFMRG